VVADYQSRGRGRHDHVWTSRPGEDLLFSVVLRPEGPPGSMLPITLVISAAASAALSGTLGTGVGVKWPNDLIAGGGKIGGVLAEGWSVPGGTSRVVVGVGVNVNSTGESFPEEFREDASSCRTVSGREWDRAAVLAGLLHAMEESYERFLREGFAGLRAGYEDALVLLGRRVSFVCGDERVTAVVDGVNAEGALRVRSDRRDRTIDLYSEEVRLEP
jgi:BirA family biotin operon repressor/biotin-[acetyl-CoA-carboxylase] ligase